MSRDENSTNIAASFAQGSTFGSIDLFIDHNAPDADHYGYGSFGSVALDFSCNVKIVDCDLEP